jgi:hypothetical protein
MNDRHRSARDLQAPPIQWVLSLFQTTKQKTMERINEAAGFSGLRTKAEFPTMWSV